MKRKHTISRRDGLKVGSGLIMIGAGLGVLLDPAPAAAWTPQLSLRFLRKTGDGFVEVGSITLPAELAVKLRASDLDHVKVGWLRKHNGKTTSLAEHDLPGREQLKVSFARLPK